ncbi:MAG: DUF1080 domain-containing protein [Sedimentisphaerales bacterium]|jgi:hypothetical protein
MRQVASPLEDGWRHRLLASGIVAACFVALAGCGGGPFGAKKAMLWNGKDFAGWKLYIPDDTVNTADVWSVKDGVIYCKGKPNGYMRTKHRFSNYRLHVEWRWPEVPANSGVLLHASGPDKVWPKCIECQLKSGSAGDMVLMNGTGVTVNGHVMQDPRKQFVVIPKMEKSTEYAPGQWNTYEIYCLKDTIRCYVNGTLQNEAEKATVTSGWICLQSEGGPIEFRNIFIEPL